MKIASLLIVAALAVFAFASFASADEDAYSTTPNTPSPVTTDPWVIYSSSASHSIAFNWLMPIFAMLAYFVF